MTLLETDLVVVGAGIVGLAHAVEAARRGLRVTVIERDARAVGASIRNFGHCGIGAQSGDARRYALEARSRWIEESRDSEFWLGETGAVVVARAEDEMAVLEEFAEMRDGEVRVVDRDRLLEMVPLVDYGILGGAHLMADLRVDPRAALPGIAHRLGKLPGVSFLWETSVLGVEPGEVRTSLGLVKTSMTVVCVGHDVDRLFPQIATESGLVRCGLQMLQVNSPGGVHVDPAVLTGSSLLRYGAFAECPSIGAVRDRLERDRPDLVGAVANVMFTQRPNGDLVIGDTHIYGKTLEPFEDEELNKLILGEVAQLFGVSSLEVKHRWRGVYASAERDFLIATPNEGARVVSVTTGIGMTTAFGLAIEVIDELVRAGD